MLTLKKHNGLKLITLDQAIALSEDILKNQIEQRFVEMPARERVSRWVRSGLISGRLKRENLGKNGGMRDYYHPYIVGELVATIIIKSIYINGHVLKGLTGTPIKGLDLGETAIVGIRDKALRVLACQNWSILDLLKLHHTLKYQDINGSEWVTEIRKYPKHLYYILRDTYLSWYLAGSEKKYRNFAIVFEYNPETNSFTNQLGIVKESKNTIDYVYGEAIEKYLGKNPQCKELVDSLMNDREVCFAV